MTPFPWNVSLGHGAAGSSHAHGTTGGSHGSAAATDSPRPRERATWDAVLRLERADRGEDALAGLEALWSGRGLPPSAGGRELRARLLARMAETARAAGNRERALELVDRALADAGNAPDLFCARARVCLERGDDQGARDALGAALARQPAHAQAAVELALLEARSGSLGDAIGRLERLGASWPAAGRARFAAGVERLRAGAWETAEEELRAACRESGAQLAEGLARIGRLLEADDAPQALAEAASLSERQPDAAEVHARMGLCDLALGWLDDAAEAFGRALERSPDDHEARLYLAWVLFLHGETAAAEGEVARVLAACPGHELALALWHQQCDPRPAPEARPQRTIA